MEPSAVLGMGSATRVRAPSPTAFLPAAGERPCTWPVSSRTGMPTLPNGLLRLDGVDTRQMAYFVSLYRIRIILEAPASATAVKGIIWDR